MPLNAAGLHAALIPDANESNTRCLLDGNQNYGGGIKDAKVQLPGASQGTKIEVKYLLAARSAPTQFQYDTALWYGAIRYPGTPWKADLLLRAFGVLCYGGIVVCKDNNGTAWDWWAAEGVPVAATISHTARVTIQLGKLGSDSDGFWGWLWGGQTPVTRAAATHGIQYLGTAEVIQVGNTRITKYFREVSGNKGGVSHFGVNIALGGSGYKNPVSGKTIRDNGKHGHFYLAYKAPTTTHNGAVLIACEQSAPLDSYAPHERGTLMTGIKRAGMFFKAVGTLGVPDQYGGYHGFGGHSRFSSTGGDDWTRDQLGGYGPQRYYDGMFMDLSQNWNQVRPLAETFTADDLGEDGCPAPPPPRQRGNVVIGNNRD